MEQMLIAYRNRNQGYVLPQRSITPFFQNTAETGPQRMAVACTVGQTRLFANIPVISELQNPLAFQYCLLHSALLSCKNFMRIQSNQYFGWKYYEKDILHCRQMSTGVPLQVWEADIQTEEAQFRKCHTLLTRYFLFVFHVKQII